MSVQFKYLFTQLEIGPVTTKNRIQYTPTASNFAAVDGLPSETMAYYVAERAKGGTGLIDFSLVIPSPEPYLSLMVNTCIRGYDSRVVPGYKKIADMAHEHGAKVFAELASWGAWSGGYAPSPVPSAQTHGTPQILTKEGIEEIANYYGTTAKYVKEGGLDGVDLHGTHGLLINQFLSPMYNKRTDEYGGSTENRMRFLLQILDRVRENVGSDIAVGMRLIGDELIPGGINIDEAKKIAQRLDASGKVDFINMDIGIEPQQVHIAQAPLYVEPGFEIYASAAVKEVVKKVVVGGVGRIHDPMLAE
ncbi:MAG: NADH:flavin oxidoreductase, partial [Candidatus Bathyarchaeia archaeon]